jgi:hypothetical protein
VFSVNGTNASKNPTATFSAAGDYTFLVTIANGGVTVGTSSVTVIVNETLTKIVTSPSNPSVNEDTSVQFTANATDQFGNPDSVSIVWSTTGGTVGSGGLVTAPASAGSFTVKATSGSVPGSSSLVVSNAAPTIASAASASPSPVLTTFTYLNVLGADDAGEANLTYTWSVTNKPSGAATPTFAINGTNAAKSNIVTFYTAGSYTFLVTVTDSGGLSTTSSVTVSVTQSATTFVVSPSSASVAEGTSQQFTAVAYDQWGVVMPKQPSITWSVSNGGAGGTISSSGGYTAPAVLGMDTVQATSGFANGQATVNVIAASLGIFTANGDFGTPAIAGSSSYNSSTGVYSVSGAGTDISGTADQFQYLYEPLTGDGTITAEVSSITNTNGSAKAGIMFRSALDAGSADMFLCVTPTGGIKLEGRTAEGVTPTIYNTTAGLTAPYWLRLTRVGNAFAAYISPDGVSWTLIGLESTTMGSTAYVGLAVTSHNTAQLNTSTFQNVTVGAATSVWIGGGDGTSWGNALNWAPNAVPGQSDNVSIPSGVAGLTIGSGAYAAHNLTSGSSVTINGGSLALYGVSTITGLLSIQNGGTLDVTDGSLMINYAGFADPISTIGALIASGFNNGAWNGTGIISSTAALNATTYGVGYADSADPGNPAGLPASTIEIRYTLLGDANLDGAVNGVDFGILAANFNKGVSGWDQGDFNYDGVVNGVDFGELSANFNKAVSLPAVVTTATQNTLVKVVAKQKHHG